jgi:tetratricopeptide (TPR) repeat protein
VPPVKIPEAAISEDSLPIIPPTDTATAPQRRWPAWATYLICLSIIAACGWWIQWRNYRNWRDSAIELAQLYKSHGYLHESLLSLRNALEEHPDSPEVNYQMGEILYALGRREEAAPHFKKVLEAGGFPSEIEGSLNILGGDTETGIALLTQRLRNADNETQGMLLNDRALGEIFSRNRTDAWGDLKRSIKLWTSPVPRFNFGTLALEDADGPTCVAQLEGLRQEFPGNPLILNNLALCYALLGENDKAIFLLNSAVDHSMYSPYIWKNLAILTGNQLIPLYQAEADEIKGDDLSPIPYIFAFSWQLGTEE